MIIDDPRLVAALAAIDAVNAQDPTTVVMDGVARPKELLHAELMSGWVVRLDPDATPEQLLAARAHHIRRWAFPRSDYPAGRAGYLRWRAEARRRHGAEIQVLLGDAGFDDDTIARVGAIVTKEGLRSDGAAGDPQVQTHEDALCLVFLQTQLDDVIAQLGEEHASAVVAKTLPKMSARARSEAATIALSDAGKRVLTAALAK